MVRMARLGLAMAPMLSLKVLTNFRLSLVTSYERILTNFNTPSSMVVYGWLLEASEDVHKTKKLGINGHNNISKGHQLPM